ASQARSFFNTHIERHLVFNATNATQEDTEIFADIEAMITELQSSTAEEYKSVRSLTSRLSTRAVRALAERAREQFQSAASIQRSNPGVALIQQNMALMQSQAVQQIAQRLYRANATG